MLNPQDLLPAFAAVARTFDRLTVSIYRAQPGVSRYSCGDARFDVNAEGEVTLPDAMAAQIGLERLRRHPQVERFTIDPETGALGQVCYPGHELVTLDSPPPDDPPADAPAESVVDDVSLPAPTSAAPAATGRKRGR